MLAKYDSLRDFDKIRDVVNWNNERGQLSHAVDIYSL